MAIVSLSRFISLSIHRKPTKVFTFQFSTASYVDKFCTLLQKKQSNVEKTLALVNAKLDSNCVCLVLERCSFDMSQMGLRFFIWAGLQSNYRHSSYTYSKACEFLKIKQNPFLVLDVIEAYKVEECLVNVKMFKVVLNLCREARIADEALSVLRKMPEFNLRADTTAYNVVIRLFCEKGDMDMADKLMKEIGLIDLYPDIITYLAMIKGFCNAGRLEDACGLFQAMRVHGCFPNAVLYSALLEGICRYGSTEKALEFLGQMEKEGGSCTANVITYTSVIKSFCEKGQTMEALRILDRMGARGCTPNRVTVITLIKGLCAEGHVDEAYKLIDKVVAGGAVSNGDCYSSLVVSLIRINRLDEAEKLFRKMLASGAKPDSIACSIMIREICNEGRVLDGFFLYDEIERMRYLSSIDSDIYSILLVGLCQQNHLVEAAKLARLMLEKKIHLKAPYVDKIVEHLKNSGDEELVTQLSRIGK
ncbi:pentatricopeptide repeat-containing protein At5g47360-like isoform X1 [Durio zibethinus]|uniref:Pentatricopeptide repeat-containing protein At5g47360-like isoform X1 n=2 Tax=Durio zibethinus TaxID=66656 RepID=A0A6P5WRF2_DURZI|nr:pentatricopeptide repeat-containing protein At5g47360-like isoform X1 [Durio zibethinus]